ncbi:MAG: DUF1295 domain-containing protein [Pseudomonadota bacterium]
MKTTVSQAAVPVSKCPKSEIDFTTNVCGLVVFVGALALMAFNLQSVIAVTLWLRQLTGMPIDNITVMCLIAIAGGILTVVGIDIFVFRRHRTARVNGRANLRRVAIKFLALLAILGFGSIGYSTFPEYDGFYSRFFDAALLFLPVILALTFIYFWYVDRVMEEPEDGYYHMGRLLLRYMTNDRRFTYDMAHVKELVRVWLIKLFFLPLMFCYLALEVENVIGFNYASLLDLSGTLNESTASIYDFLFSLLYGIDLVFATCGYIMTLKLTNSEIRSAEPTLFGWLVCLVCYKPFVFVVFDQYLQYNNGFYWGHWLQSVPLFYMLWAATIIGFIVIYTLASVSLGFRFSNLTYRGLSTSGVYRLTKHPAYVAKNITWWMISIPFIPAGDIVLAAKLCAMLVGVNLIYYWRARTEENHLSNYPEYVAYANWMNEHGALAWLGRLVPYLRYDEERAKRSGSVAWWRKV